MRFVGRISASAIRQNGRCAMAYLPYKSPMMENDYGYTFAAA